MKRFWEPTCAIFLLIICNSAYCEISTTVSLRDSNLPLSPIDVNTSMNYIDYGQIMVGTQLAITVSSDDASSYWAGVLLIEEEQRNNGVLYGRGGGPSFYDSCLEAAGPSARLSIFPDYWEEKEKYVQGFNLYTDHIPYNTGDWFVIDYNAVDYNLANPHDCNVALYWQDDTGWPIIYGLIHHIRFDHVPTRDFNSDSQVDFQDYSLLSWYWYDANCADSNDCEGADLDFSGTVDTNDIYLFADYWLVKTK